MKPYKQGKKKSLTPFCPFLSIQKEYIDAISESRCYISIFVCFVYVLLYCKDNLYNTKEDFQEKYSAVSIPNL